MEPPDGIEQQPALHAAVAVQAKLHRCVMVLQPTLATGQSTLALQPHTPPPVAATQMSPDLLAAFCVTQLAHTPPLLPQAVSLPRPPPTQVPLVMPVGMLQQPVLHGVVASQVVTQACVVRLQAW